MRKEIERTGRYFTYILECQDGTYYTGYTNDLEIRLKRHNDGLASKYTRARLPVRLVWSKEYRQFKSAFKVEAVIKQFTRLQKESLVKGRRLDKVLEKARKYENRE